MSSSITTALILNNGKATQTAGFRGKSVFAPSGDVSGSGGTTVNYRGSTTQQQTLLGTSGGSSNSNSQSYIYRRSPNSSNSTSNSASNSIAGVLMAEPDDEQQSMLSLGSDLTGGNVSPPHRQNGLLVQYSDDRHHHAQHNYHVQQPGVIKQQSRKDGGMATIAEWLNKAPHQNGFIRVFLDPSTELSASSPLPPLPRATSPSSSSNLKDPNLHPTAGFSSVLVPCSLTTTVEQVCSMIGIAPPSLCVQLNSGKVSKLSPNDRPLQIQTSILAQLGFDITSTEIMREGIRKSLSFICRFLSAKQSKLVLPDVCKRISSYLLVKRPAAVLKTWERRLCSLCGSKLQIHKYDQHPADLANVNGAAFLATTVFELAGATVTESAKTSTNRNHPYTVRIELATGGGKRIVKLAFDTPEQKIIWARHLKLAATNQSRSLDLSGSDLELLPDAVFQIAEDVQVFNLKDNQLLSRPSHRGQKNGGDDDITSSSANLSLNPAVLGFLDDLARFRNIQILNLSNNDLVEIPKAIFELTNMTDLNVGTNKIRELSHLVQRLQNLKQLNCQSNRLTSVPAEMLTLRRLVSFNVSFNRFLTIPETLARLTNMRYTHTEELQLAGNFLGQADGTALTLEIVEVLEQVRKIDLRFNAILHLVAESDLMALQNERNSNISDSISAPLPLASLQYCTILDLSFNRLERLDLREMKSLETVSVNNNQLTSLILNGTLLKHLNASYNRLEYLACEPNPDFLERLDVSKNLFKEIPACFHNCPFLISANYGHNAITAIPGRYLFNNRRLRFLRLHCNAISSLDDKLFEDLVYVEELYVQSNAIASLPDQLFNRAVKLKVLNASKNRLRTLPRPLASLGDISRLQALYLSNNQLTDDVFSSLSAFPRLKYLHLARNRLTTLDGAVLAQLEFLQDLNVSENLLTFLPNELSSLAKLQTLRVHNNGLVKVMDSYLPEALQVLDLSCNRLSGHVLDIFPRNPTHLSELDLSGNAGLHFGDGEFIASLSEQLQIMAYDEPSVQRNSGIAGSNIHNGRLSNGGKRQNVFSVQFGTARTAGSRNKPSVYAKTVGEGFRSNANESMAALFDGGLSSEVPKILQAVVPELVEEECEGRTSSLLLQSDGSHMKRTFLAAHRELKGVGQRLGASAAICHFIAPTGDSNPTKLRMFVGNVGDVEVLLCFRDGTFRVLTENFRVDSNVEDVSRAIQEGCVITDNCKLNGIAEVTRLLGCGFLFPAVIPNPNVTVFDLDIEKLGNSNSSSSSSNYATVVLANRNLWRFVTYVEVCQELTRTSIDNPLQAAKRLLDMAQCFGSTENIGVVVAQIFFPATEYLGHQNQQNEHHLQQVQQPQLLNNHVLTVKPWTKDRQNRKIAELNGDVLTQHNRTATTASLQRNSGVSLPPAGSLDLNPYGISVAPNGVITGVHHNQSVISNARRNSESGSTDRGLFSSSSSNNGLEAHNGSGGSGSSSQNAQVPRKIKLAANSNRQNNKQPNSNNNNSNGSTGDDTTSTCTTENSNETVKTAVWIPTAVLHQYGGAAGNSTTHLHQQHLRQQRQQQPAKEEPQALSIRIDAADNPRKPRVAAPQVNGSNNNSNNVSNNNNNNNNNNNQHPPLPPLLPSRISPPTNLAPVVSSLSSSQHSNNSPPQPHLTQPQPQPMPQQPVAVVAPAPPPVLTQAPPIDVLTPESIPDQVDKELPEAETNHGDTTSQQQTTEAAIATDDSINSAVDTILLPPPAPYGDYEFVSYL